MLKLLTQPFPINSALRHGLKISVAISLFVFLFLLYFQPFELESLGHNNLAIISGYGAVCLLVIRLNLYFIPRIIPSLFNEDSWKVYHQFLWVLWVVSTVALAKLFFDYYLGMGGLNLQDLISNQIRVLSIAFFPVLIGALFFQTILLKKDLKLAIRMNEQIRSRQTLVDNKKNEIDPIVVLSDENQKDQVKLSLANILYIVAADNYVEVNWKNGDKTAKKLLRITLKRIYEPLKKYNNIFRCHRAFIVNLNNVKFVKGNSQGLKLIFENIELKIPVARRYVEQLKRNTEEFKPHSNS